MPQIIPTAEPFLFPGSQTGCLLIHGFTGVPKEMRWMGEYLHHEGYTVLGPRLSGHALRPEDMVRSNYTDWTASVEDGFRLLAGAVKRIYLVGLSMGGALALRAAAQLPVQGVVAMSTPYKLPDDWRLSVIDALSKVQPYMPKRKGPPDAGWFDKEAFKQHISYPQNPVRSLGQLNRLLSEVRAALPKVSVPVLLIHSRNDKYVPSQNMLSTYEHLGTADKQMLWVEGSGHVITEDARRQQVFAAAAEFIRRIEAAQ